MYIIENITKAFEKTKTLHAEGDQTKTSEKEIKTMLDEESFKILKQNGAVVFEGKLIRKA